MLIIKHVGIIMTVKMIVAKMMMEVDVDVDVEREEEEEDAGLFGGKRRFVSEK